MMFLRRSSGHHWGQQHDPERHLLTRQRVAVQADARWRDLRDRSRVWTPVICRRGRVGHSQYLFVYRTLSERVENADRFGVTHTLNETAIRSLVLYEEPFVPEGGWPVFGLQPEAVSAALESSPRPALEHSAPRLS